MDLGKQLKFPENFVETSLITDIVLLSETSKQVCKAFSLLLGITRPATKEASYFLLLGHMNGN